MKIAEFLDEILIGQIDLIQNIGKTGGKDCHFLSFSLICSGIEFLGACLDDNSFEKVGQSERRFKAALKELFPVQYHEHVDILYASLRCGLVHVALPQSNIGLTQEKESRKFGTKHLSKHSDRLILISECFFDDFKKACSEIKKRIGEGKLHHPKLLIDFFLVQGGTSDSRTSFGLTEPCSGSSRRSE